MITPCKDCQDRNEDCHGICEKYKEWKIYHDELMEKERRRRKLFSHYYGRRKK